MKEKKDKVPMKRLLSKDFLLLFSISFIGSAGMQMFQSIMSKYAVALGCPDGLLGIVVSAYAVMVFLASIVSGTVSDNFNKKYLLIFSMIGQSLAILGYAFLSGNMALLIVMRMLHGLCFGFNIVVTMSLVSFALPKEILGTGMGVYGLGQTLSMAVGPSIGLALINSVGFRSMFLIAFTFVCIASILAFFVSSIPVDKVERTKFNIKNIVEVKAVPVSLIGLFNAAAYAAVTSYLVIHAEQQGVTNIGLFFTVYAVVLLVSRPVMGRISDKYPLKYTIYPASVISILSLLLIAISTNLLMFLAAAFVLAIGFGGSQPVLQAASLRDIIPQKRGAASATYSMGQSSGFALGPLAAGFLAVSVGYDGMFAAMTGTILCGMAVLAVSERRKKHAAVREQMEEVN